MREKQLPLILILMMLLVACGAGREAETPDVPLELPRIATAVSEEMVDESADAAEDESAEMANEALEESSEESEAHSDDSDDEMTESDADMDEEAADSESNEAAEAPDESDEEMADAEESEVAESDDDAAMADDSDAEMEASEEVEESEDSAESDDEAMADAEEDTAEASAGTTIYVVQSGDSLSEIAETFEVSADALLEANDIENADQIYVGQPLIIPLDEAPEEDAEGESEGEDVGEEDSAEADADSTTSEEYIVQAGDTLSEIAEQFDIPIYALAAKNGISDRDGVFTEQILLIPAADEIDALLATPLPEPTNEAGNYVVQPGDSLAGIAIRFGVTLTQLANANNISDYDTVYIGQTLVIP